LVEHGTVNSKTCYVSSAQILEEPGSSARDWDYDGRGGRTFCAGTLPETI